jgi:hypothetical protein
MVKVTPNNYARCGQPVTVNASRYDMLERMHWLCFHLEFEHDSDPDEHCEDPACPWWHIQVFRRELQSLGRDPQKAIERAIAERWKL